MVEVATAVTVAACHEGVAVALDSIPTLARVVVRLFNRPIPGRHVARG
jgi:hypothetical protein